LSFGSVVVKTQQMNDIVIRAQGLGKKYIIGHQAENERYVALRDVLARTAKGLVRSAREMMCGQAIVPGDTLSAAARWSASSAATAPASRPC